MVGAAGPLVHAFFNKRAAPCVAWAFATCSGNLRAEAAVRVPDGFIQGPEHPRI